MTPATPAVSVPARMPQPQSDDRMGEFIKRCLGDVLAQVDALGDRTISGHQQYALFRNAVKKYTTDDMPEELVVKMTLHLMGLLDELCEDAPADIVQQGEQVGFAINVATGEAIQVPMDYALQMGAKHVKDILTTGMPPVVQGVPPRMPEADEDPLAMD